MNERIQQLAEEAELNATLLFNKEKLEKFSQLIVRECMLQIADVRIKNDFEPVGDAVLERSLVYIKKHFGVDN